jgi:glycine dehydrogenase subunit 1
MNIPHTEKEIQEMLSSIGLSSLEELFSDIPESVRLKRAPAIPSAMAEGELRKKFRSLSRKNYPLDYFASFLGAGVYRHYIPSAVKALISRGEFATAYTPYQAEASQGTLQAVFEFQTLICRLMGMEVANASHYDGATSLAESALMALDITQRDEIIVSRSVHPHYRQVLQTYLSQRDIPLLEVGIDDGITSLIEVEKNISQKTAAVLVQYPNFFGCLEPLEKFASLCEKEGALLVVAVLEPLAFGLLSPPGLRGASIVAGEGQSMGIPPSFGGPHVGFIATKQKYVRRIPGRLVGETRDKNGKRAFTLTLQTREQHIRREKASSNVCTNQSLCAVANAIYLSLLGKQGVKEVSQQCWQKAHYAFQHWTASGFLKPLFKAPFYHEFVVRLPMKPALFVSKMEREKILAGYPIGKDYPEYEDALLLTITEVNTKEEISLFLKKMEICLASGDGVKCSSP